MVRTRIVGLSLAGLAYALLLVPAAWAQQSPSGIAGAVKDPTGGPVANVTVEAASEALIEKVRTAVTDAQGQYKIINLVPGAYIVTFKAGGFGTVRHEGVELASGFTATVNADLKPGNSAETVTVTGVVTQVDTQNIRQQNVLSSEVQSALPTGQKDQQSVVTTTAGLNSGDKSDVGGSSGAYAGATAASSYHGKGGVRTLHDGFRIENANGGGGPFINSLLTQQTVVEKSGCSAESVASGATINSIPKSGSNRWSYSIARKFTNGSQQAGNLDQALRDRGLQTEDKCIKL